MPFLTLASRKHKHTFKKIMTAFSLKFWLSTPTNDSSSSCHMTRSANHHHYSIGNSTWGKLPYSDTWARMFYIDDNFNEIRF